MAFDHSVWKGGTIALVCLILFTMNVSAWNPAEMQNEIDNTVESNFGSSFDAKFDTTADSDDSSDSDTTRQVDVDTDPQRTSNSDVSDSNEWDAFEQRMNNLDSSFSLGDSDDSNQDTTRRTDDRTDRSSDDQTDDSTTDRSDDSSDDSSDSGSDTVNPSGSTEAQAEQYLHQYINDERRQRGLAPLDFNNDLRETARAKSQDMAQRGYFSHDRPTGENFRDIYTQHGISRSTCRLGAENIARTWFNRDVRTDTGSIVNYDNAQELADGLRRQWMTSSAHRDAILRERYNEHGLGIEITDSGRVYASEHFCT
jgi:uncharacterized protein YkwD